MPKHPLYHLLLVAVAVIVFVVTTCRPTLGAAAASASFMGLAHGADSAEDGQADDSQYNNGSHSISLI